MNDPQAKPEFHATSAATPKRTAPSLQAMLDALWESSKPAILQRVNAIRQAHLLASIGKLDESTARIGAQEAHKLSGVLGTFGLPRGTDVSRQIEQFLDGFPASITEEVPQFGAWLAELETLIAGRSSPL